MQTRHSPSWAQKLNVEALEERCLPSWGGSDAAFVPGPDIAPSSQSEQAAVPPGPETWLDQGFSFSVDSDPGIFFTQSPPTDPGQSGDYWYYDSSWFSEVDTAV